MTNHNINVSFSIRALAALLVLVLSLGFTSCKEEIDESNFAIKSEQTAADYINSDPNYSMIKEIFSRVRLGNSEGASPIMSVLTARGNYTIFLPTNSAVEIFMQENGIAKFEDFTIEEDSLLAKSCILDHGNDNALETADFPTAGSFSVANLNDRLLSCKLDNDANFLINNTSKVIKEDIEVSNGFIHIVDHVVAPSALTVDRLLGVTPNTKVFTALLTATTWADSLRQNIDITYEDPEREPFFDQSGVPGAFVNTPHRYVGYTAFIETDSVYESVLGLKVETDAEGNLTNGDAFVAKIAALAEQIYGSEASGDYTKAENALNRFVAYHFLNGKMPYNKLNVHNNEYNYKHGGNWKNPQRNEMPTNVWDYYITMGNYPKLLKVTQVGDSGFEQDKEHHVYLNRISVYANGPEDDYHEVGVKSVLGANGEPIEGGILVNPLNGEEDNNALNGYYYPIDKLLFYTDELATHLQNERLRMDMSIMLPELMSNNIRTTVYTTMDKGYFENISRESPDTRLLYLMCPGYGFSDYQGDEFMVCGLYDFVLKIPPVPKDGTYEIRMGVAHNPSRGMCQIYFGTDPDRLMPAGLPYDMRQPGKPDNPAIPWFPDDDKDWQTNFEHDRNLRNQGYMKGPKYFHYGNVEQSVRERPAPWSCLRRIITVAYMEADKEYYLRFKTALKKSDSQFFMDYIEYASTNVYNGPVAEDIW